MAETRAAPAAGATVGRDAKPAAATAAAGGDSWEVLLSAPLQLHNALPVPLDVSMSAWGRTHRVHLQPNQHGALHSVDAAHVEHLQLRALGYHPSPHISPAPLPALAAASLEGGAGEGGREVRAPDVAVTLRVSSVS